MNNDYMNQPGSQPTSTLWSDFNDAEDQNIFDVIPKNTLAKVCMRIRPGGFDDFSRGWNGGYATQNEHTGAVYLNCEFVVLEGPYAKRKVWSLIGLHSPKGPEWTNMGRAFVKSVLNSAFGLSPNDHSNAANQRRCIGGMKDLDGLTFAVKIDMEQDQHGDDKNVIKSVICAGHKDYARIMGGASSQTESSFSPQHGHDSGREVSAQGSQMHPANVPNSRPDWAQ